ncbi:NTF2-like N-terminal transpeptidase domain-containing protein [Amycolatopsis thermoflava]|uniref:NTF2-like N-terminal transpeptidase domain-containing protein n=1 Tax=Amycolatopsis thermoflava TaxID=84480 RepID=UPI003EBABE1F
MRTKKWLLTCGVLAVIAIVTAAIVVLRGGPDSTPAGDDVAAAVGQYLRTWSDGDDRQAGALTDDPRGAGAALAASRSGLGASAVTATLQGVSGDSARVRVKWTLGQGRVWTYDNVLTVVAGDGAPRVHFTPAAIHPELGEGDRLAVRAAATGVALVDRDGKPLLRWRESFQLLIDIKSDGPSTYQAVDAALREFRFMLTQWTNGHERSGAVEVVISGNRPRADMLAQRSRLAGYDGRLADLGTGTPAGFMPLVSDNWTNAFTWQGVGPMPAAERAKLHGIVAQAHEAGYRIRFWATPDTAGAAREAVWRELLAAGVDHVNTDDLAGLREFLLANDPAERVAA